MSRNNSQVFLFKSSNKPQNKKKASPTRNQPPLPSKKKSPWLLIVMFVLIAGGAALWFFFLRPLPIKDGEPFQPARSGSIRGGTYTVPSLTIQDGVKVKAKDDLILNVTGEVNLSGSLVGDCVDLSIISEGNIQITGSVDNLCGAEEEERSNLSLISNGAEIILGSDLDTAVISTSGDFIISNDPTLENWYFDVLPEQLSSSPLPPVCYASADILSGTLEAGSSLTINFSGEGADPDGGELWYSWNFGDGYTDTGSEVSHEYTDFGTFPVTFTVEDNENEICTATLTILIESEDQTEESLPPAVQIQPDALVVEQGEQLFLDGSTAASAGADIEYSWNFGDGSTSTDIQPSHIYTESGIYTINLTATTESSQTSKATALIYVFMSPETAYQSENAVVPVKYEIFQKTVFSIKIRAISPYIGGNIRVWSTGDLVFQSTTDLETRDGRFGTFHGGSAGSLLIYAREDIIIEEDVYLKAGNGGDGLSDGNSGGSGGRGGSFYMTAGGSIYIDENTAFNTTSILAGNGGAGGDAAGKYAYAGCGGNGGAMFIRAYGGTLDIGEDVIIQVGGDGGNGGDASDSNASNTWVHAGNGGRPGSFRLSGRTAKFSGIQIIMGNGGQGGSTSVDGADGADQCSSAKNGVSVAAVAGNGGNVWGCYSTVNFDLLNPSTLTGGNAGDGGEAYAEAGNGGTAACQNEAIGGDGGNAYAAGGKGGNVGSVKCNVAGLNFVGTPFTTGNGGEAYAEAGNGGKAEAIVKNCGQDARAVGGDGGRAGAFGGSGGSQKNGLAGDGGDAEVITGTGGNALARGGDCSDNCLDGGNAEARGGDAGDIFAVRGGSAGTGRNGVNGDSSYTLGTGGDASAHGGIGGDCDICPLGDGGAGGDASAYAGFGGYYAIKGKRASGGSVEAVGGMGGEGATCCDPPDDAGSGGKGGDAMVQEQISPQSSRIAGDGGDGGAGDLPGDGGPGGFPNGLNGWDGGDCFDEAAPAAVEETEFSSEEETEEEAAEAEEEAAAEEAAEEAAVEEESGSGSAPEILFIEFPVGTRQDMRSATNTVVIPADSTDIKGLVGFYDPDDSISYVWFEPIQTDTVFNGFGFYITDEDLVEGDYQEGVFSFYIYCSQYTREIFNIQLMDVSGNWFSSSALFGFTCR